MTKTGKPSAEGLGVSLPSAMTVKDRGGGGRESRSGQAGDDEVAQAGDDDVGPARKGARSFSREAIDNSWRACLGWMIAGGDREARSRVAASANETGEGW